MTNALLTSASINFADSQVIKTLKETVAKGTTDAEFALFASYCNSTGLNPFKKEVWCIKTSNGIQIMTGLNGYREIANRHLEFDGIEGPDFQYGQTGELVSCEVRVFRKDRSRPAKGVAIFSEVVGKTPVWGQRPHQMLSKCAEVDAYRKCFPSELNGLYAEEEMPRAYSVDSVDITPPKVEKLAAPSAAVTKAEIIELMDLCKKAGFKSKEDIKTWANRMAGEPVNILDLTQEQYATLVNEAFILVDEYEQGEAA